MKNRIILVIEDNPISQRLIRRILARDGLTIVEALTAQAALAHVAETTPDLVLLDLGLPDMDGLELLRLLREVPGFPAVPVIAVSGYVARLEQARQGGAGFVDILTKPVDPEMVVRMVEAHLPHSDQTPLVGAGRRVLAIDDSPLQLRLLARTLEQMGFVVAAVTDSSKALGEARRFLPDGIVCDVLMPQPDGFRVCALVRQDPALARVPVVLATSAYVEAEDRHLAESVGANALVVRTPGFEGIIEALLSALGAGPPRVAPASAAGVDEEYARRALHQLERRAELNVELARRCSLQAAELAVLTATSESLARRAAPNLGVVLEHCLDAGGVSAGAILELRGDALATKARVGLSETHATVLEERIRTQLKRIFQSSDPVTIGADEPVPEEDRKLLAQLGIGSLIVFPLISQDERVGVLALTSQSSKLRREDWLSFVKNVAAQIGQALALVRAFARIEESDARYRTLANSMPQIVWSARPDGTAEYYNDRWYEYSGLARGTEHTDGWLSVIHPDDVSTTRESWRRAQETGEPWELEYRLKGAGNGAYRWHLGRAAAARDPSGTIVRWFGTATDIDDRKQAERALQESEEKLRQLAERADEVFYVTDPLLTRVLYVSPAYERIWMRSIASVYERALSFLEGIHEDDRERIAQAIREDFPRGQHDSVFRVVRPDGSLRWCRTRASAVRDVSGAIVRMTGTVADITELKVAAETEARNARSSAFMADVALAVTNTEDAREAMRRCTDAAVRHLDLALSRVFKVGDEGGYELKASSGLVVPLDPARPHGAKFAIDRLAETRQPYTTNELASDTLVDREWVRREGLTSFAGYPLEVQGRLVGIMTAFARGPLDERRLGSLRAASHVIALALRRKQEELENELLAKQFRQAQKMEAVGRLAGGVAHDFNNLLTAIMGYSELMLTRLRKDDPLRRDIEEVRKAGTRATSLTHQLLVFSRHQVLELKVLDVNAIVSDMEKMLRRLIGEDLELRTVLGSGLGQVKADAGQVEQVLLNLSVNARDAMPRGGRLTIVTANVEMKEDAKELLRGLAKPGPYVMIAVTDTGCGMSEDVLSHLFEPFFTTKEAGKGTGLGLSTVFGIAQSSGGFVSVESKVGEGSTFKVYFPRVNGVVERTPANGSATSRGGSETVLLVEDDEMVRSLAHRVLEMNGYSVLVAENGGEGLLLCEQHAGPIDLVISDVVMPKMSGPDLVARLEKLRPGLKVLFTSGYTSGMIQHEEASGSGKAFLQKPFTPKALALKVREVLDGAGPG